MKEIANFSFKMFKMRFLKPLKCAKTTWNSPEQPIKLTLKLTTETTAPYYKDCGTKFILGGGLKFQSSVVTIVGLNKSLQ